MDRRARLQVGERALDQHLLLLEVNQQVVPQRLLRQHLQEKEATERPHAIYNGPMGREGGHLGVAQHDQPVFGARECHIEPPRVVEEADALPFVGAHTR